MKKHTVIFQKQGDISIPVYREQFVEMISDVKDGEYFQGDFKNVEKVKSDKQLGYIYSAVYPHLIKYYSETQGYMFQIQRGDELIDVEPNKISADLYMKTLFCIHKSIADFKKEKASHQEIMEYIDFMDKHSIDRFSCPLPPPKRKE
jgi:hypothetical protein